MHAYTSLFSLSPFLPEDRLDVRQPVLKIGSFTMIFVLPSVFEVSLSPARPLSKQGEEISVPCKYVTTNLRQ